MKKQIILILGIFLSTLFVTAQTTPTDSATEVTEQTTGPVDSPIVVPTDPGTGIDPSEAIEAQPSLQDGILNNSVNNPILFCAVGLLLYLFFNIRMMKIRNPGIELNAGTWLSGNYMKVILFLGFIAYVFIVGTDLSNLNAFAIGFAPAKGIDWMKKELKEFGIDID